MLVFITVALILGSVAFPIQYPKQDPEVWVHLIPHSHDDVGWLKTVDQYYTGANPDGYSPASVRDIITTVMAELIKDERRTFTQVEIKFFSMWWNEQNNTIKEEVRKLLNEGRLEFANAGWSMHDEACPIYEDMLNNMMYGNQWIYQEFGIVPKIGWHIDPFGHTMTNARLFADMGFDAWVFARHD